MSADPKPLFYTRKEFLEWAARVNPLSGAACVIFVSSGRRFRVNVRISDLKRCFFCEMTDETWPLDEFLPWGVNHTRSIAFDYWSGRLRLNRPPVKIPKAAIS